MPPLRLLAPLARSVRHCTLDCCPALDCVVQTEPHDLCSHTQHVTQSRAGQQGAREKRARRVSRRRPNRCPWHPQLHCQHHNLQHRRRHLSRAVSGAQHTVCSPRACCVPVQTGRGLGRRALRTGGRAGERSAGRGGAHRVRGFDSELVDLDAAAAAPHLLQRAKESQSQGTTSKQQSARSNERGTAGGALRSGRCTEHCGQLVSTQPTCGEQQAHHASGQAGCGKVRPVGRTSRGPQLAASEPLPISPPRLARSLSPARQPSKSACTR